MRKTLVIALRDYLAAVRTKSFVISLALMPVLVAGGILVGRLSRTMVDVEERRIAIIDHTFEAARRVTAPPTTPTPTPVSEAPAGATGGLFGRMLGTLRTFAPDASAFGPDQRPLYQVILEEATRRNSEDRVRTRRASAYTFSVHPLAEYSAEAISKARLELSERVRDGDLFAFIEIGPSIIRRPPPSLRGVADGARALEASDVEDLPGDEGGLGDALGGLFGQAGAGNTRQAALLDAYGIRYSSKNTTNLDVITWLQETITPEVYQRRLADAQVPAERVLQLLIPPTVQQRPLAVRGTDGAVAYEADPNLIASLLVPVLSVFLLFSLIGTAAFPLTTNIIEEKQMRIAEVLLGSVRPFELMLGKLLGGVAISLTLAAIYGAGGLIVALQFDFLGTLGAGAVAWFVVFAALATLMVGAMSVAAGAAVTNLKEAQNIQAPIVLLPMLPALVAINIAQNPQGPIAHIFTWFPLTTPITSVMRIGVRDGMPTYERVLAAALSVATTCVIVWLAGRIFRHGMLRSEKAAGMGEMARWLTRG